MLSHVQLFGIPRIVANKTPLSMEFAKQEYWSGLPFPTPEDLPNPGIEPVSLEPPALAGGFFTIVPSGKPLRWYILINKCEVDKAFRQKKKSSPVGKPILGRTLSDPSISSYLQCPCYLLP